MTARCPVCQQEIPTTNEDDDFERLFWPSCRRKVGKVEAKRAYKRLRVSEQMRAIEDIKIRYEGVEIQFIPYPATYLNGKRFDDPLPGQTIPDPPKKVEPDGGIARRTIPPLVIAEYCEAQLLPPEQQKARLQELVRSMIKETR